MIDLFTGIWGFHDRRLTLRKALHDMLTIGQFKEDFKRRWKYHQEQVNKQVVMVKMTMLMINDNSSDDDNDDYGGDVTHMEWESHGLTCR